MPPTAALRTMTGRLFIRKPMYTRQMTGRKPRQVSRLARNIPLISRPTSSKKRPTPVLRGGVLFHARAGLEIVCRREQTHGM